MQRVFEGDVATVEMLKDLLVGEGIDAGSSPASRFSEAAVWVNDESQLDRAVLFVTRFKRGEPLKHLERTPWKCPQCGEALEAQFEACWNCGTPREAAV